VGHTISHFSWDHVLARGFRPSEGVSAGRVQNALEVSDHLPVWAKLTPE
jgi:endonuclease/exonuclease/phosphatase family metal-dependent hydrolase